MYKPIFWVTVVVICLFFARETLAQQGIDQALTTATNQLKSIFDKVSKLGMAASAIVGLIGGIKVYRKFTNGDQDTFNAVASWGGGALFLLLISLVLKVFTN